MKLAKKVYLFGLYCKGSDVPYLSIGETSGMEKYSDDTGQYVFLEERMIEVEVPEGDSLPARIAAIRVKQADLAAEHTREHTALEVAIQNLLALPAPD